MLTVFLFIFAYILGSFPTAIIIGNIFFKTDIRNHGSKNPGAVNSLRVFGWKFAIIILLIDVLKGMIATYLPILFSIDIHPAYFGLVAVIGHCYPLFANFRGGKAIATTAGMALVLHPILLLSIIITFFGMMVITKYLFFGSISVGIVLIAYSILISDQVLFIVFILFELLLIFLHRSNIQNYLNGTELKFNDKRIFDSRQPPKK